MRVILSNVVPEHDHQKLEFELINPVSVSENASVTLIEKESLASITVPVKQSDIHPTSLSITIDSSRFQFEFKGKDEFEWQLFFCCGNDDRRIITQVEGEYVGPSQRLNENVFYQYDFDPCGMATFYVRTNRSKKQFVVNTVNLTKKGALVITGFNQINKTMLTGMEIVIKRESDGQTDTFPITQEKYHGIFQITIPASEFVNNDVYRLFIKYNQNGQEYTQRLVVNNGISYFKTKAHTKGDRRLIMKEGKAGQLRIVNRDAPKAASRVKKFPKKIKHFKKQGILFYEKVRRLFLRKMFKMGHTPYEKPTVVFESFGGRQISDSPYAIYQAFKKNYPNMSFVWSVNRSQKKFAKQHHINYVIKNSFKWARVMGKAKVWVSNSRFPAWVKKPKYVTYVQTWHGTPLKKLGLDIERVSMPGTTTNQYHQNFVREANRWDALISPNDFSSSVFRSAFGYHNQILKVGYPRNDELINDNNPKAIAKLKEKLKIPKDKKVVLYAPTYRDNQFESKGKYTFKLPFSLDDFKKRFGDDTVLILRMHYLISNALDISEYSDFVYDMSSYPNISDLYLVSDMLVTDYSSVFFDYAYLKRPILFYPYDYHSYKDELRGFYLNYERDLPGRIVHTNDELMDGISYDLNHENVSEDARFMNFYNRFCSINDGLSSFKVIDYILSQVK